RPKKEKHQEDPPVAPLTSQHAHKEFWRRNQGCHHTQHTKSPKREMNCWIISDQEGGIEMQKTYPQKNKNGCEGEFCRATDTEGKVARRKQCQAHTSERARRVKPHVSKLSARLDVEQCSRL